MAKQTGTTTAMSSIIHKLSINTVKKRSHQAALTSKTNFI